MKVKRIEQDNDRIKELQVEIGKLRSQFQPVHIVLETQDEVDQVAGLLYISDVYVSLPIISEIGDGLVKMRSHKFREFHKQAKEYIERNT